MIIVLKAATPAVEIEQIKDELSQYKVSVEKIIGKHRVVIGLVGDTAELDPLKIQCCQSFY